MPQFHEGPPQILSTILLASTSLGVMNEFVLTPATVRFSTCLALCSLTLAMAATGCSTFNRDWNQASATPALANGIDGRWEGSWLSDRNGHHGRLRCLVSRLDDRSYRARFKATYWKFFRFGYGVNLQVTREPNDQGRSCRSSADRGRASSLLKGRLGFLSVGVCLSASRWSTPARGPGPAKSPPSRSRQSGNSHGVRPQVQAKKLRLSTTRGQP